MGNTQQNKKLAILFAVLAFMVMCFIFNNSLQGSEVSNSRSGVISAFLKQLIDPANRIDEEIFHIIVRKLAHFTEFAALGLCLGGAAVNWGRWKGRRCVVPPVLLALLIASCDEFIQRFTGRTSAIKDVAIDFTGALFGLFIVWVVTRLLCKPREKKDHMNSVLKRF